MGICALFYKIILMNKQQSPLPQIKANSPKKRPMSSKVKKEDDVTLLLRKKINSYMQFQPIKASQSKLNRRFYQSKKSVMSSFGIKAFPAITQMKTLITQQKQIQLVYRQKMELNCEQCLLFYMQILAAAIKHEFLHCSEQLNPSKSVLIDCFLFVAESLLEIGHDKLAFFFCYIAIQFCQIYKSYHKLGYSLYMVGIITRKMSRFQQSIVFLKKALEYLWKERRKESQDLELEVYNEFSYNFLQSNNIDQSKIFGFKYEIGYLQREDSKIISLSNELVTSVQRRKPHWHSITTQSMELVLSFNIELLLSTKRFQFQGKIQQNRILNLFKVNFDLLFDNLLKNDIFFYEIPLPLEMVKSNTFTPKTKRTSGTKFMLRKRSSLGNLKVEPLKQKPKQQIIFNNRGHNFSKHKLLNKFLQLVESIKEKI